MSADHQGGEHDHKHFGQLSLSVAGSPLRTYWLTQPRTTIGRRATNVLVLDDLTVSGEHAMLLVGQQDVVIQDLGSRNGTLLNGRPIARALLSDGDCIDIGIYRLVYSRHGQPEQGIPGHDANGQRAPSPWGGQDGVGIGMGLGVGIGAPPVPGPAGSWDIPPPYGAGPGIPSANPGDPYFRSAPAGPTPPPNHPISGFPRLVLGDPDLLRRLTADFPSLHPETPVPAGTPSEGPPVAGNTAAADGSAAGATGTGNTAASDGSTAGATGAGNTAAADGAAAAAPGAGNTATSDTPAAGASTTDASAADGSAGRAPGDASARGSSTGEPLSGVPAAEPPCADPSQTGTPPAEGAPESPATRESSGPSASGKPTVSGGPFAPGEPPVSDEPAAPGEPPASGEFPAPGKSPVPGEPPAFTPAPIFSPPAGATPSPDTGFIEGFTRAPRLGPDPAPLPNVPPPMPRRRPPLNNGAGYRGASLRFLGGHDAGRLLVIDRPIVSIRNGCGQVAVVSSRADGFFLTHVEGQAYPLINGESIGLGAHPLRNHDLIELSGTIIQFSQSGLGGS